MFGVKSLDALQCRAIIRPNFPFMAVAIAAFCTAAMVRMSVVFEQGNAGMSQYALLREQPEKLCVGVLARQC